MTLAICWLRAAASAGLAGVRGSAGELPAQGPPHLCSRSPFPAHAMTPSTWRPGSRGYSQEHTWLSGVWRACQSRFLTLPTRVWYFMVYLNMNESKSIANALVLCYEQHIHISKLPVQVALRTGWKSEKTCFLKKRCLYERSHAHKEREYLSPTAFHNQPLLLHLPIVPLNVWCWIAASAADIDMPRLSSQDTRATPPFSMWEAQKTPTLCNTALLAFTVSRADCVCLSLLLRVLQDPREHFCVICGCASRSLTKYHIPRYVAWVWQWL